MEELTASYLIFDFLCDLCDLCGEILMHLILSLLPDRYAVCQFPRNATLPISVMSSEMFCIMKTFDELSIVCEESRAPEIGMIERGWRIFKLEGPFPFEMTGVLASVVNPLAQAGVSIFALSTYDTDYVLVKEAQLEAAITAIKAAGHSVT
jgi:hypothetical protein